MTQQVRQLGGADVVLASAWAAVQSVKRAAFPLDTAKLKGGKNLGRWRQTGKGGRGVVGGRCQAHISAWILAYLAVLIVPTTFWLWL